MPKRQAPNIQDTLIKAISIKGGEILKDKQLLCNILENLSPDLYQKIALINKIYTSSVGEMLFSAYSANKDERDAFLKEADRILEEEEDRGPKSRKEFFSYFEPLLKKDYTIQKSSTKDKTLKDVATKSLFNVMNRRMDRIVESADKGSDSLEQTPVEESFKEDFYLKGLDCYNNKKYDEAINLFIRAIENGALSACLPLGNMYQYGEGVHEDYHQAIKWYKVGADGGVPEAQVRLGYMFEKGMGVKADRGEAIKLYRKAAIQDNKEAKDRLLLFPETQQEELEVRIGERISAGLTKEELEEFETLDNQTEIKKWLEKHVPNYGKIVIDEKMNLLNKMLQMSKDLSSKVEDKKVIQNNNDGSVTEGYKKNGEWEGEFKKTFKNGAYYIGTFLSGKVDGKLTYVDSEGRSKVGIWKDGNWNGKCRQENSDNSITEGFLINGIWNGPFTTTHTNGIVYKGTYVDGEVEGELTYIDLKGNTWIGEWSKGNWNGKCRHKNSDNTVTEGFLINGIWNGPFTKKFASGIEYKGTYVDGEVEGELTYIDINGNILICGWNKGNWNGDGTFRRNDGVLTGKWVNGEIVGKVIYKYNNGCVYEGEIKNYLRHGRGKMTFPDKAVYDGEWAFDKYNGHGVYTRKDGFKYIGEWGIESDGYGIYVVLDSSYKKTWVYDGPYGVHHPTKPYLLGK